MPGIELTPAWPDVHRRSVGVVFVLFYDPEHPVSTLATEELLQLFRVDLVLRQSQGPIDSYMRLVRRIGTDQEGEILDRSHLNLMLL